MTGILSPFQMYVKQRSGGGALEFIYIMPLNYYHTHPLLFVKF